MSPGWADGPISWIVHRAANSTPKTISLRLEEEWQADLSALDGTILQLRFALGCCRAALAMRRDSFDAAPDVPSARPRTGEKSLFTGRRSRVREDAFTWLERLRRGLREDEGSELRVWLKRRSHRACIARVAAQKDRFDDLAVLGEVFPVNPEWVVPRQGRSPAINAAAAFIALCLASLPLFYTHYSVPGLILGPAAEGSFMEARGTVYASGANTLRRVSLPDGTRVVLNHGTRIAVLYSGNIRSVLLVRGEATFTVPRQAHRSFGITAGDRYFGTEASTFNIRLTGRDAVELTVLEGAVTALEYPVAARKVLNARQTIDIGPGTQSARSLSQIEAQARIAWQR